MFRRIGYVALNYLTRPMVWAIGGVYIVVLSLTLFSAHRDSTSQRTVGLQSAYPEIVPWGPVVSLNAMQPLSDFEFHQLRDVIAMLHQPTGFKLPGGEVHVVPSEFPSHEFSAAHLGRLRGLPHLRSLTLKSPSPLTDQEMQAVGDLSQLHSLSLAGCRLTPEIWRQLARLPKLRYLDLSGCSFQGDYPGLESLSQLETLVLRTPMDGGFVERDASLFPQLSLLPNLRTLVVGDYTHASAELAPKGPETPRRTSIINPMVDNIDDLQRIATLRQLFVDEQSGTFPGYEKPQRALKHVKIRPAFIDATRQHAFLVLVFLNSNLLLLLALQLYSQFSHAGAQLIPNYRVPHLIPVVAIWLLGIMAHCLPLLAKGVPFWSALGANLGFWIIFCTFGVIGAPLSADPRRFRWFALPLIAMAVGWVPLSLILLRFNRSSIDWYLRGQEPLCTGFLIVWGVTIASIELWRTLRLYSAYLERGIISPPLSLDPVAMAEWQQQVYWQRARATAASGNRLLRKVLSRTNQHGLRRRSELWVAGNINNGNLVLVLMSVVVLMGWLASLIDGRWVEDFPAIRNPFVLVMSVFFPDLPVIALASLWRNRRRMFPIESLRPVSRAEFSRQIATAIAWDLTPLAAVYLAVLCWYVAAADPLRWSWGWTIAALLVFIARWIAAFGLLLWGIVIRHDWQVILLAATTGYTLLFVNLGFAFLQGSVLGVGHLPPDLPQLGGLPLIGIALFYATLTSSMAALAYRRWRQIELL